MNFPEWLHPVIRRRLAADLQRRVVAHVVRQEGESDRTRAFITSSEVPDRYGDIIRQAGWDFSEYRATNGPFLFGHGLGDGVMTIGRSIEEKVLPKFKGMTGPVLQQTLEFAPEGANPLADTAFKLVDAGIMTSTSVGFLPLKIEFIQDEEERKELGLGPFGVIFSRQMLMETSLVDVPANPEVTILDGFKDGIKRGLFTEQDAAVLRALGQLTEPLEKVWVEEKGVLHFEVPDCWDEVFSAPPEKVTTIEIESPDKIQVTSGYLHITDALGNPMEGWRVVVPEDTGATRSGFSSDMRARTADAVASAIDTLNGVLDDLDGEEEDSDDPSDSKSSDSSAPDVKSWYDNFLEVAEEESHASN